MTNKDIKPINSPLSDSSGFQFLFDVKDHSISGELFSIYDEQENGFRFTFPVPDEIEIARYYDSESYISHSNSSSGFIAKLFQLARSFTMGMKARTVRAHSNLKTGNILDFGCGTGEFANHMKKQGWNVAGIEPGNNARTHAIDQYKLNVFQKLEELPEDSIFDVITAWHVLEHVHDLHQTLEKLRNLLTENGRLIIALPNFQSFDASFYKEIWAGYDVPRHLYHFSPKAVNYLANRHNLEVIKTKRMVLDSFYISLLSESYLNTGIFGIPGALVIGFWSNVISFFNKNRSSSLIYTLKKR